MQNAQVTAGGARIRWVEIPGSDGRTRVYLHGLGASSGPYFTASAVHGLLVAEALSRYVALPHQEAFDIELSPLPEATLQPIPPEKERARGVAVVVAAGRVFWG